MIVNISVLHHHSPVLEVSINHQSQSYGERSREKDMFFCELRYQPVHRQQSRENQISTEHLELTLAS